MGGCIGGLFGTGARRMRRQPVRAELALVEGSVESRRWREQMERCRYFGCRVPFGANLRSFDGNIQALGLASEPGSGVGLLCTLPAGRTRAWDAWIGWDDKRRRRNLQRS